MATIQMKSLTDVCRDVNKRFVKAGINTVNIVAATARKNAQRNIEKNFTLRNNFTKNSMRFEQCSRSVTRLSDIKSSAGITERAEYMARQETGGQKKSASGANLIIPHTTARGGSNANLVQKQFRYNRVSRKIQKRKGTAKNSVVAAAGAALKKNGFIRINDTIFKVDGFNNHNAARPFKATPILNMRHKSTYTPKKEWLMPAAEYSAKLMQDVFNREMDKLV